jgi:hypothetical protein
MASGYTRSKIRADESANGEMPSSATGHKDNKTPAAVISSEKQ